MVSKSAFCLSMFTDMFNTTLRSNNKMNNQDDNNNNNSNNNNKNDTKDNNLYLYKRAHWECGMIGQILYTEGN